MAATSTATSAGRAGGQQVLRDDRWGASPAPTCRRLARPATSNTVPMPGGPSAGGVRRCGVVMVVVGVVVDEEEVAADVEQAALVRLAEVGRRQRDRRRAGGDHPPGEQHDVITVGGVGRDRGWRRSPCGRRPAPARGRVRICSVDATSSPAVGSSSSTTSPCWARPWATNARWRSPPDSSPRWRAASRPSSTRSMASSTAHAVLTAQPGDRPAHRRPSEGDDLADGHREVGGGVLGLQHVGDAPTDLGRRPSVDGDGAARRFEQPGDGVQQRRLARAVGTDEGGHPAGEREVGMVDDHPCAARQHERVEPRSTAPPARFWFWFPFPDSDTASVCYSFVRSILSLGVAACAAGRHRRAAAAGGRPPAPTIGRTSSSPRASSATSSGRCSASTPTSR